MFYMFRQFRLWQLEFPFSKFHNKSSNWLYCFRNYLQTCWFKQSKQSEDWELVQERVLKTSWQLFVWPERISRQHATTSTSLQISCCLPCNPFPPTFSLPMLHCTQTGALYGMWRRKWLRLPTSCEPGLSVGRSKDISCRAGNSQQNRHGELTGRRIRMEENMELLKQSWGIVYVELLEIRGL